MKAAKDTGRSHKFATKLNSVNVHVFPAEKMKHESVDMMVDLLKTRVKKHKKAPHLWKADIDAAFRRVSWHSALAFYISFMFICFSLQIPIAPEDRWACGIAFESDRKTVTSQHITAPFGSVASIHAWERIGAALAHLAPNLIKIPVLRYVDDFFGPEMYLHSWYSFNLHASCDGFLFNRSETAENAMKCFARLVKLLMGDDAISADKLDCGVNIDILGVSFIMNDRFFQCRPAGMKVAILMFTPVLADLVTCFVCRLKSG